MAAGDAGELAARPEGHAGQRAGPGGPDEGTVSRVARGDRPAGEGTAEALRPTAHPRRPAARREGPVTMNLTVFGACAFAAAGLLAPRGTGSGLPAPVAAAA